MSISDSTTPQHFILQRFLHVCKFSGIRHLGLTKRVQENNNLLRCVLDARVLCERWTWIPAYAFAVTAFFQEAEYIRQIVYSRTPHQNRLCGLLLMGLIGKRTHRLMQIQNTTRKLVKHIHCHSKRCSNIAFTESCLEDHEIFFEDMKSALLITLPANRMKPWDGLDYTDVLLKFDSCQQFEFFDEERGAS